MPRWFEQLVDEWSKAFIYLDPESYAVWIDKVRYGHHDFHGGNEL